MRMPRFRFTVRRMMVAVAIVGACVWGVRMLQMSRAYGKKAERFASNAMDRIPGFNGEWPKTPEGEAKLRRTWDLWKQEMEDHNAAMAAKYRRAARYPWLPVAPDPPEPE
jgi:hypothetical protein